MAKRKYALALLGLLGLMWAFALYTFVFQEQILHFNILRSNIQQQRQILFERQILYAHISEWAAEDQEPAFFWETVPEAMAELSEMMEAFNVRQTWFFLGNTVNVLYEHIYHTSITLEGIGDYSDILLYIQALQQNERFVWVESILMRPYAESNSTNIWVQAAFSFYTIATQDLGRVTQFEPISIEDTHNPFFAGNN